MAPQGTCLICSMAKERPTSTVSAGAGRSLQPIIVSTSVYPDLWLCIHFGSMQIRARDWDRPWSAPIPFLAARRRWPHPFPCRRASASPIWAGQERKAERVCPEGKYGSLTWMDRDGLFWTASSGIQNGGTLFLSLGAAVDQEEGQPSNALESLGPNCPVGAWERDDEYYHFTGIPETQFVSWVRMISLP
jgi:hypothetical protein